MIYYFSGTGNSKLVCELLATQIGDSTSPMTAPQPCTDNVVGIIFPVYAWGMPNIVLTFLSNTLSHLLHNNIEYIYTIMTCGDDIGYTDRLVRKSLQRHGLTLHAAFSLQMPNTYVCLPGFDVDKKEIADNKVATMRHQIPIIASHIQAQHVITDVNRGVCAHIKTYILCPLFNKYLINDRQFHVDNSRCVNCGQCVQHCPVANIELSTDDVVTWKGHCTGCLGCYHICPNNAIQYGRFTKGKGQKQ